MVIFRFTFLSAAYRVCGGALYSYPSSLFLRISLPPDRKCGASM